ncbi:MAG: hypothetical protein OSB20_01135 [Porticoccaceae bacterium]|nr:hypothetical protein [Porticoccaceae bacterium]
MMKGCVVKCERYRIGFMRSGVVMMTVVGLISLGGCMSDPYDQCMKKEKRKNAYLGEEDYLKQSSKVCARKARQAQ